MSLQAFNQGVNVLAYTKDNKSLGMTFAWGMMVDYDKIMMLIGEQSDTGNNVKIGDIVGVSALNKKQINIALQLGDNHSLSTKKFEGIAITKNDSAILINEAKVQMVVKVIDIIHTKENPNDNLIYGLILSSEVNESEFLSAQEMK